jgi:ribosomal-protein-alanine N-acetyltransferase
VVVRPWSETDQACADQAAADARLAERLGADDLSLAIARADTEEAVGLVAVRQAPQEGVAGIVFWVRPELRRRGLATRAVWLVTGHALDAMAVARLEAWVQPSDQAGAGVLRRCGFMREGLLRSFLVVDGLRVDVHVYSRLAR